MIYMIHDIDKWMLNYMSNDNTYSYDDSLFSHYYYIDQISQYSCKLNITTNYIQFNKLRTRFTNTNEYLEFETCSEYMSKYTANNKSMMMNLDELLYIFENYPGVEIVAHSHYHEPTILSCGINNKKNWKDQHFININPKLNNMLKTKIKFKYGSRLANIGVDEYINNRNKSDMIDFIHKDTNKMLEWFNKYLNYIPTSYCFPWNQSNDIFINIWKEYGFTTFYGSERQDISELKC